MGWVGGKFSQIDTTLVLKLKFKKLLISKENREKVPPPLPIQSRHISPQYD